MKAKTETLKRPKLAIRRIEKLAKELQQSGSVKVGLPKGSNAYPDGTSVIKVGIMHEFGSPANNIPQRSFLRATVEENQPGYKKMFRKLSEGIVDGRLTELKALNLVGLKVTGDVQTRISDGIRPRLKYREGTPLYNTGHLLQSITYQVTK